MGLRWGRWHPSLLDPHAEAKNDYGIKTPEAISSPHPPFTIPPSQTETEKSLGAAIDPISRVSARLPWFPLLAVDWAFQQIFERTKTHHSVPRILPLTSIEGSLGLPQRSQAGTIPPDVSRPTTLRRNDSVGSVNKGPKDKKWVWPSLVLPLADRKPLGR